MIREKTKEGLTRDWWNGGNAEASMKSNSFNFEDFTAKLQG